jgi:hypothetical protein
MRRRSSASLAEACGAARPEAVLEGPLEGMVRSIKDSLSLAGPWPGEAGGHRFLVYMVYLVYIFCSLFVLTQRSTLSRPQNGPGLQKIRARQERRDSLKQNKEAQEFAAPRTCPGNKEKNNAAGRGQNPTSQ